jgi:hypothetical protein
MAGPDLTPQSFARGLWSTTFPNPDTPTHAGHVGFQGGVYSMTQDAAEFWVSDGTPGNSPYSDYSYRAVCYVDRGVRRSLGTFPKGGDPFFKGPCYGTA